MLAQNVIEEMNEMYRNGANARWLLMKHFPDTKQYNLIPWDTKGGVN